MFLACSVCSPYMLSTPYAFIKIKMDGDAKHLFFGVIGRGGDLPLSKKMFVSSIRGQISVYSKHGCELFICFMQGCKVQKILLKSFGRQLTNLRLSC